VNPTPLDIDMIREMYRERVVNVAGVDPRLNASRIAQRLRVGRRRIAARLRVWKEAGFLPRYDVWPNPALLGVQGGWVNVRAEHRRAKPEVLRSVGLVDGVVYAVDFVGEWLFLGLLGEDRASLERKASLLRGLTGVATVEGPVPWTVPDPKRPLTALDLRVVRALREQPDASLRDTARRVGVSTRTMTRRYSALVDDRAVWFVPLFDFRALVPPVVALSLTVRAGTSPEGTTRALRRRFPLVLESPAPARDPGSLPTVLTTYVTLPSAANVEELELFAGALPGVDEVEALTMVRVHSFPDWFDRHLSGLIAGAYGPRAADRRSIRG
jgi:DNA-binding Lrp family transcriptional regulator